MVHELMEKSDGPKEKALQANNAIENYMFDNCEWCIQPNKSAFCLVHKGLCPVNPGWALGERFSGTSPEQLQQKLSTGHGLQDCFEGVPAAAWWTSPDFKAEPEDTTPPLVVNISSLICVDFSPLGKQSRTGGDSQQFHSMFLATRRANAVRAMKISTSQNAPDCTLQPLSSTGSNQLIGSSGHRHRHKN